MKVAAIFLGLVLCFCEGYEDKTVVQWILDNNGFTTLAKAVKTVGLVSDLSTKGPFTIFAPTDDAFNRLGVSYIDSLLQNPVQLGVILKYHVVNDFVLVPTVNGPKVETTLAGRNITITPLNGGLQINMVANVSASNSDIIVNNGVIQPINRILVPPNLPTLTIAQYLIQDDSQFKDLALALILADLLSTLDGNDFTLFAPVDSAFAPYKDSLLDPNQPNAKALYQEVLKNHVVPGARSASQLSDGQILPTLHGATVTVKMNSGGVNINNATVTKADILCTNGIIHAINAVLVPSDIIPPTQG